MSCGNIFDIIEEPGRERILLWRRERMEDRKLREKKHKLCLTYTFDFETLYGFILNFNFMVFFHMLVAGIAVYISRHFDLMFDVQVAILVSPIAFPVAFAINQDFQRRESALYNLKLFKSAATDVYFCVREWRKDVKWNEPCFDAIHGKLKSLFFLLPEYLFTYKKHRRRVILSAMYEDFSDLNQLIENFRTGDADVAPALISSVIKQLYKICLSFEHIRNVKEYRSPRSIRAFNKVLVFLLPVILSPYFVSIGDHSGNNWIPFYVSIAVAFVFSSLQVVQDKLDDPFDGIGEDDIEFSAVDDWRLNSFDAVLRRSLSISRDCKLFKTKSTSEKLNTQKSTPNLRGKKSTIVYQKIDSPAPT